MDLKLSGKHAVITGGSKGIGYATALTLAREGAHVALIARTIEDLEAAAERIEEETGAGVLTAACDVADADGVKQAVLAIAEKWDGKIDILVNNAGTSAAAPFEEVGFESWEADIGLKLMGAVHMAREALPFMKRAGSGAIVNVTAIGGKSPGAAALPSSVTRAAGIALTKAMSRDFAADGIRVNAVCIGMIRSDQIERKWRSDAPELSWEEYARDPRHAVPLGRIGETREAADAIVFLVSDAASYITGTALNIDGGKSPVT